MSNLDNYPVYILNVVPELPEQSHVDIPQHITSSQPLSYNFYVPPVEHQDTILNTEGSTPLVSQKNNTKSINNVLHKKTLPKTQVNNPTNIE